MLFFIQRAGRKSMASYLSGRYEAERNHTQHEADEVECVDCFSSLEDPDEEYCNFCGDPLCLDCQNVTADEPLCSGCFSSLAEVALESLRRDPQIGDLFRRAA